MSAVEVKTADTYKDDGHAYRQGLMDPHMGVIEPGLVCPTDNCKYDESPGHFGHIALELPVIHIGFVNAHQDRFEGNLFEVQPHFVARHEKHAPV